MMHTPAYKANSPHLLEATLKAVPGLYTRQELMQWKTVTQLGPMRKQMTSSLLLGSCKSSQSCGIQTLQSGDEYNFSLLKPIQDMANILPWWTRLPAIIWTAMDATGRIGGTLALMYLSLFLVSYGYRLSTAAWRKIFWSSVPVLSTTSPSETQQHRLQQRMITPSEIQK